MWDLGDVVPLSINITDSAGAAANAGSVTVAITLPNNTTVTSAAITPTVVGQYDYAFTTTLAGRHSVRWVATGVNASTYTEVFEVRPQADQTFISIAEMKDYLNIPQDKVAWDQELRDAIACACNLVEFIVGPVHREQVVEYYNGGSYLLMLDQRPVISVDEVIEVAGSTPVTLTKVPMPDPDNTQNAYTVDLTTGQLWRRNANAVYPFAWGVRNIKVTYTPGRATTPPNVNMGTKELISHLWRQSQLNSEGRRPRVARPEPVTVIMGYAVPNRVIELLQATPRIPTVG